MVLCATILVALIDMPEQAPYPTAMAEQRQRQKWTGMQSLLSKSNLRFA
jgi:hypothetical protein